MDQPKLEAVREAALSNAESLIRASRLLAGNDLEHVRFNLAVIALEEVGKASIIGMRHIAHLRGEEDVPFTGQFDDHVKKLFWSLWGQSFLRERLTREQIERYQRLATHLHERRLLSLYSDPESAVAPAAQISAEETERLVGLVQARIGIERAHEFIEPDEEARERLEWFLTATDDPDKRTDIFGDKSLEKLRELGSVPEWVKWLREIYEKHDEEMRALFDRERERQAPDGGAPAKPKWLIKLRIYSHSHSIRQTALNDWNAKVDDIKLFATGKQVFHKGKKDELRCEFRLSENTSANALWFQGWGMARAFVVALNVATRGFFWWYVPSDTSGFYDEITDLENSAKIQVTEGPRLEIDWGNRALKPVDLGNTSVVLGYLFSHMGKPEERPFNEYVGGLVFLSKIDFHLRGEANAFDGFWKALREALLVHGAWDGSGDFDSVAVAVMATLLPDATDFGRHLALGSALQQVRNGGTVPNITLSEVIGMKLYCDVYLWSIVAKWASTEAKLAVRQSTET